jgi:hypothetical protein
VLVYFLFPRKDGEQRLLERYAAEDAGQPEPERYRRSVAQV